MKKLINKIFYKFGYKINKIKKYDKNKIIFLHISKNAGTQIMNLASQLKSYGVDIEKFEHYEKFDSLPLGSKYFFSIRDPISRFKSGFYSRKREGMPRHYSKWSPNEKLAFKNFNSANDLAESLFKKTKLGHLAAQSIQSITHTSMQQIDWFNKYAFFEVNPPIWIIRQENFIEDFDKFLSRLGLKISSKDLNILTDDIGSHRNIYNKKNEFSDLALRNLRKWYARDYIFYEICNNWIRSN
tara:strand:- start:462 stop:1184 length:723 start_codon:yes stop_codon:yes gene_type:complete